MTHPLEFAHVEHELDGLNAELCQWFGCASYSLLQAQGIHLPPNLERLAHLEAGAVAALHKWLEAVQEEGVEHWIAF